MTSQNNRNRKMGSVARNAPYGTDIQPNREMKIIGGKQIEIYVVSPPASASTHRSLLPPLSKSPTHEYNNNNAYKLEHSPKQEHLLQPKTVPPDKSNSNTYGSKRRLKSLPGSHPILPPISSPNSLFPKRNSWNPTRSFSTSPTLRNACQPHQSKLELTEQLSDHLADYDPCKFHDMYKDLAEFDRKLCGYASQPHVNMIAMKHDLPLSTSMMRLLFSYFGKDDDVEMVNYERLIQYLAKAQLGTVEAGTLLPESVDKFIKIPCPSSSDEEELDKQIAKFEMANTAGVLPTRQQRSPMESQRSPMERQRSPMERQRSPMEHQRSPMERQQELPQIAQDRTGNQEQRKPLRAFSHRQDAKLIMLLEQQYIQGHQDPTDLTAMRKDFNKKDKMARGMLSREMIQEVCFAHRVPVQGSLMDKLLQRCDTGDDQYSWSAFVEFLSCVNPLATVDNPDDTTVVEPPPRPNTWPNWKDGDFQDIDSKLRPPGPSLPPRSPPSWETRKPLGMLGIVSPTVVEKEVTQYDSPSPVMEDRPLQPNDESIIHKRQDEISKDFERAELAVMAEQHKQKRRSAAAAASSPSASKPNNDEPLFTRFKHLALGLYNLDSTNTGYLSKEETTSFVNNYNLIYNLNFTQSHIDRCINSCCYFKGQVDIEHLLEALMNRAN